MSFTTATWKIDYRLLLIHLIRLLSNASHAGATVVGGVLLRPELLREILLCGYLFLVIFKVLIAAIMREVNRLFTANFFSCVNVTIRSIAVLVVKMLHLICAHFSTTF